MEKHLYLKCVLSWVATRPKRHRDCGGDKICLPVILERRHSGVCGVGSKIDVAEGLLDAGLLGELWVIHVAEGVHQAHGQGEGQAQDPDEHDDHLGEGLGRLATERVQDGAVPGDILHIVSL